MAPRTKRAGDAFTGELTEVRETSLLEHGTNYLERGAVDPDQQDPTSGSRRAAGSDPHREHQT